VVATSCLKQTEMGLGYLRKEFMVLDTRMEQRRVFQIVDNLICYVETGGNESNCIAMSRGL